MNIVRSIDRCSAVVGSRHGKSEGFSLVFSASMIHTIPGDTANSDHRQKCGSCSTEKSSSNAGNVQSAAKPSRITTRLCPTTSSPKVWEGLGEMTIPTISKQFIGGAISRRDREDYESGEVCEGANEQTSIQPINSDENPIPSATTPRCCRSRWIYGR